MSARSGGGGAAVNSLRRCHERGSSATRACELAVGGKKKENERRKGTKKKTCGETQPSMSDAEADVKKKMLFFFFF